MAAVDAAASDASAEAKAASARAEAAYVLAVSIAVAAHSASAMHALRERQKRVCNDGAFYTLFEAAVAAEGVADVHAARDALAWPTFDPLPPRPLPSCANCSTEGQCEGKTRYGERCKVHRSSPYAIADSLRRGERFCEPCKCCH